MELERIKGGEIEREWQVAGDRLLLYLRCLNFTVPQALHLALRALKEAEMSMNRGSNNNALVESIHALHQILNEGGNSKEPDHNHVFLDFLDIWCERPVQASPPINRLSMVAEK